MTQPTHLTQPMRTIGLLGGMSWESTQHYYRLINEAIRDRLGGFHSAQLLLYSLDFAPIERMQANDRWDEAGELLADAAARLERGGADFLLICANTMHKVAPAIEARVAIPLIHIVDPTAAAIRRHSIRRVGLLGTRFTMEQPFYRDRLTAAGFDVVTPAEPDRRRVHDIIYQELVMGRVEPASREAYRQIAARLVGDGAEGVIFGCTEISMLIGQADVSVPVFDTTELHAAAAVDRALG